MENENVANIAVGNTPLATLDRAIDVGQIREPLEGFNFSSANADMAATTTATTWATTFPVEPVAAPPFIAPPSVPPHPQFNRMKGAKWFEIAKRKEVMILGQGGIGSWLTLMVSRLGPAIYTYDMDMYEEHNMTGQLVRVKDIGKLKTTAMVEICREFNAASGPIYPNGEFTLQSFPNSIMLCGFDNMNARKLAFVKWKEFLSAVNELKGQHGVVGADECFFQDGRLTAEQIQIFNVPGDRPDLIELYEKEHLFEDKEGFEGDCTFKQTSHAAAMIASHMVGFYTNWLTGVVMKDKDYAKVPFKYEYIIPYNLTMQEYVNT